MSVIDKMFTPEVDVFLDWWEEHPLSTREELTVELRLFMPAKPDPMLLFCDDSFRYALNRPWIKDGVRYATDNRVMVAVPVPGFADSMRKGEGVSTPRYPNCAGLLQATPMPDAWQPLKGAGESFAKDNMTCPFCLGYGRTPWHARVCEAEECEVCEGRAVIRETDTEHGFTLTAIGDGHFSLHYINRILEFAPDAECGCVHTSSERQEALRFRFDGGEGVLMGVQK